MMLPAAGSAVAFRRSSPRRGGVGLMYFCSPVRRLLPPEVLTAVARHRHVDDVRIGRIGADVKAVARRHLEPVLLRDAAVVADAARTAPYAVVLRAAVDEVRLSHVDRHLVELPHRHPVLELPASGRRRTRSPRRHRVRGGCASGWRDRSTSRDDPDGSAAAHRPDRDRTARRATKASAPDWEAARECLRECVLNVRRRRWTCTGSARARRRCSDPSDRRESG